MYTLIYVYKKQTTAAAVSQCTLELAHINASIHSQLSPPLHIQYTHVHLPIYMHRCIRTYNVYAHICICKIDQRRSSLPVHSKSAHINASVHLQLSLPLHIQYTHVHLHIYIHRHIWTYKAKARIYIYTTSTYNMYIKIWICRVNQGRNTLQHTATHCNTLTYMSVYIIYMYLYKRLRQEQSPSA